MIDRELNADGLFRADLAAIEVLKAGGTEAEMVAAGIRAYLADPDTLIVEKVNGREAMWCKEHDSLAVPGEKQCGAIKWVGYTALCVSSHVPVIVFPLDALLAYQTGDTE